MKLIKTDITQTLKVVILALVFTVGINYAFAQWNWQAPTDDPPEGNTASPLNVTGEAQEKLGGLILNTATNPADNGLIIMKGNLLISSLFPEGRVGIGLTGIGIGNQPTRSLDVNGDVRLRGHIYDSTGTTGSAGASGQVLTRGDGGVEWKPAATGGSNSAWTISPPNIYNANTGSVGIGTNAPNVNTKLDVNGNFRLRKALYDSTLPTGNVGTLGQVLTSTVTGVKWATIAGGGTSLWTDLGGNNIKNSNTNGNVGVNIDTPTNDLDVSEIRVRGGFFTGATGGGGTGGQVLTRTAAGTGVEWQTPAPGGGGSALWAGSLSGPITSQNLGNVGVGVPVPDRKLDTTEIRVRGGFFTGATGGGAGTNGQVLTNTCVGSNCNVIWKSPLPTIESTNSNQQGDASICNLIPNRAYLVMVYGTIISASNGQAYSVEAYGNGQTIGTTYISNHPDGNAPITISGKATASEGGCIIGTVKNFYDQCQNGAPGCGGSGIPVFRMVVVG